MKRRAPNVFTLEIALAYTRKRWLRLTRTSKGKYVLQEFYTRRDGTKGFGRQITIERADIGPLLQILRNAARRAPYRPRTHRAPARVRVVSKRERRNGR